jgi:hypothetical protein
MDAEPNSELRQEPLIFISFGSDARQVSLVARVGSRFSKQALHIAGPGQNRLIHNDLGVIPGCRGFVTRNPSPRLASLTHRFQPLPEGLAEPDWHLQHQPKLGKSVAIAVNQSD